MALPAPIIYDPDKHKPILHQVADIMGDCVTTDGTLATFLPDSKGRMSHDKILNWWLGRSESVEKGHRDIILQFTDDSETDLMGYVCLYMPPTETGPFRSEVEKLMVSPKHRYKGVSKRVMAKLEEIAKEKDRGLIVCHTVRR